MINLCPKYKILITFVWQQSIWVRSRPTLALMVTLFIVSSTDYTLYCFLTPGWPILKRIASKAWASMSPKRNQFSMNIHPCFWKDVAWLKTVTRLSVVVKGILTGKNRPMCCYIYARFGLLSYSLGAYVGWLFHLVPQVHFASVPGSPPVLLVQQVQKYRT